MKVHELKKLLDNVIDTEAEARIGHEDDNFFDGETVTGIQIIHNFVNGNDECRVFIAGDATKTSNK